MPLRRGRLSTAACRAAFVVPAQNNVAYRDELLEIEATGEIDEGPRSVHHSKAVEVQQLVRLYRCSVHLHICPLGTRRLAPAREVQQTVVVHGKVLQQRRGERTRDGIRDGQQQRLAATADVQLLAAQDVEVAGHAVIALAAQPLRGQAGGGSLESAHARQPCRVAPRRNPGRPQELASSTSHADGRVGS